MRYLGGHLGITVSALLDGQLDGASAERAWVHVHGCELCYRQVEREGWVKTQLAAMTGEQGPPPQLLGSLYGLGSMDVDSSGTGSLAADGADAWAAVEELERRGRPRRRAGIALAGAGSVSVAVFGIASLTGATLGIGGAPAGPPTSALTGTGSPTSTPSSGFTMVIAPSAGVRRLPGQPGSPRSSDDPSPGNDPTPGDDTPSGPDVSPGQERGEAPSDLRR